MSLSCATAMVRLERSASGLGDAERLALEAHLAECATCAAQASLLRKMVDLAKSTDFALEPSARARVIREALRASSAGSGAPRHESRRAWPAAVAAVAAAALFIGFWVVRARPEKPPQAPVARSAASGKASPAAVAAQPKGVPREEAATMVAPAGVRLELGAARVAALTASELTWHSTDTTLHLGSGSIRVDVTPARGSTFRVATKRFSVVVTGTSFEVDGDGVRVLSGQVRVVDSVNGRELATLGEGQNWWLAAGVEADAGVLADVAAEITLARRHLAAREVARGRSAVKRLLGLPLPPNQRAEVQSLLAECSLVEGDPAEAARLYAEVAKQYRGSLAGETASFAQARAELRAGHRNAARESFERYVAFYPNGRFSKDARQKLDELGRKP